MEQRFAEVTALYAGAGLALAAGLLMGAALKPDLGYDNRPLGPQIVAGTDRAQASGPFDDDAVSYAAYRGRIPDYVIGSDAKQAAAQFMVASAPRTAAEPHHRLTVDGEGDQDVEPAPVYSDDGPGPRVSYPSLDGGAPSDADLRAPPDQG
ncbi:MAG TPA: hypothetical protein VLI41_03235 [Phenylobacterium sp.]|uniref:hypothetical protein n=1 Tax=Phenylobacterium sp. TaxID=1871053 RepID=UPI002CE866A7|nr:hypothetical protein [Phenylobacterium sp.]HSV02197.1 hypothetical protein [Phenylobacterium sp.]